jgi:prevent-host-death family protein
MSLAEVKNHFSAVVDEVVRTHESVTVTRNGEPAVVILAGDDYESLLETLELAFDETARRRLAEAEESVAAGDVLTGEEMAAVLRERGRNG